MAHNSVWNLADEPWIAPRRANFNDRGKNVTPELFAIAITETDDIPAGDSNLPVPGALRQVFESDGMQVVITFSEQANLHSGFKSNPASTPMQARVLPFSWEELVARVGTLLDASRKNSAVTRFGDVCINFCSMEVSRSSGEQIPMTAQEFKTLRFFVSNPGRVLSRDELLNQAWGYNNYPCSRTVDNHVLKLRQKLEVEPSRPKHFLTIHSVGYKFLP
jgi:DNA-binding winged helix-turn-helix (wHTH) protein